MHKGNFGASYQKLYAFLYNLVPLRLGHSDQLGPERLPKISEALGADNLVAHDVCFGVEPLVVGHPSHSASGSSSQRSLQAADPTREARERFDDVVPWRTASVVPVRG